MPSNTTITHRSHRRRFLTGDGVLMQRTYEEIARGKRRFSIKYPVFSMLTSLEAGAGLAVAYGRPCKRKRLQQGRQSGKEFQ
jgi:hypothetical protein